MLLSACGDGGGGTPDTSTKVTALTDSGAGSLRQAITDAKAGDTLKFSTTGTVTLASPITTDKNLTIVADGVTIDAAKKGRALEVPAGVTVTIKGGTLTGGVGTVMPLSLSGKMSAQANSLATYGGVLLNNGNLTLDGTTISGGKANNGGGIANAKGATLNLIGGATVTGNDASPPNPDLTTEITGTGGGIFNFGTLNIDGGKVDGNTATFSGGGIRAFWGSDTNLKSGSVSGNSCTLPFKVTGTNTYEGCSGGGIRSSGNITITGGTIANNTVSWAGGGVSILRTCVDSSCTTYNYPTLNMSGGTISGNKTTGTADNAGGGIWNYAKANISGGTISGNSSMYGGGIYSWSEIAVTGGVIENNTATQNVGGLGIGIPQALAQTARIGGTVKIQNNSATNAGGGLSLGDHTQAVISGGTISGNKVTGTNDGGGGVRVLSTAKLTLSGGEISANEAVLSGGGLTVGGEVTMTGGKIIGNKVTGTNDGEGAGGGIRMYSASKMTASGGEISGNKAWYGAGVHIGAANTTSGNPAAEFTLAGATVSSNQVTGPTNNNGGGFFNSGKLTITSGNVIGNTATKNGGGVFNSRAGVYSQPGGSVSGNNPDQVFTQQ